MTRHAVVAGYTPAPLPIAAADHGSFGCLVNRAARPDIIVRDRQSNAPVAIVDTKWKRLSPAIEDAKHGVSQTDVYQMMAYGRIYACPDLVLLYPHHPGLGSGSFATDYLIHGGTDRLHLRSLDITKPESGIVADLAAIFEQWQALRPLIFN